jgi:hypothetical protein
MKIGTRIIDQNLMIGVIVCKRTEMGNLYYGVKYDKYYSGFHLLNGKLKEKLGYWWEESEIYPYQDCLTTTKNEELKKFFNLFYSKQFLNKIKINNLLLQSKKNIDYYQELIKINNCSTEEFYHTKKSLDNEKINSKQLQEQLDRVIDLKVFKRQYSNILKHPAVNSVEIIDNNLIISTNDILYQDPRQKLKDINIGKFKILINNTSLQIVNCTRFRKHYNDYDYEYYYHPCIRTGHICCGSNVDSEFKKHIGNNDIDLAVYTIINFIEEPNYGNPYIAIESFMFRTQQVTIKPKNTMEWFNKSYWNRNQKWDESLYERLQGEREPSLNQST